MILIGRLWVRNVWYLTMKSPGIITPSSTGSSHGHIAQLPGETYLSAMAISAISIIKLLLLNCPVNRNRFDSWLNKNPHIPLPQFEHLW